MTRGALEDKFAYQEFTKLIEKFNVKKIIETGTYYGWSSIKLSEFNIPVFTIEYSKENYNIAEKNINEKKINNIKLILGSSPDILKEIIMEGEENLLLFLDAHWYDYWPIHDELRVCIEKKIKPIIVIHDFFVPDGKGSSKFGFDKYKTQNLDFDYIKNHIVELYGENNFEYHYTEHIDTVDSGLIYIYPKK